MPTQRPGHVAKIGGRVITEAPQEAIGMTDPTPVADAPARRLPAMAP